MNFQIGQKVVYIGGKRAKYAIPTTPPPYYPTKGETYIVQDVIFCSKCGRQSIDIGFCGTKVPTTVICPECTTIITNHNVLWWYSSVFAPLEEYEASEKMVKELLEPIKEKI